MAAVALAVIMEVVVNDKGKTTEPEISRLFDMGCISHFVHFL
jgi:hypothetical protein